MPLSPRLSATWPRVVLGGALVLGSLAWLRVGTRRWFIADDWNLLLYRDVLDGSANTFLAYNGRPIVISAFQFSVTGALFDWSSYVPFMLVTLALYIVIAVQLFVLMVRHEVAEWPAVVAVLVTITIGTSTEFPVLATISNFEYSMVAALAGLIVVSRPDPRGHLTVASALLLALATLSSAFTIIFLVAIVLSAAAQGRWRAALPLVVPPVVVYGTWWLLAERPAEADNGQLTELPGWIVAVGWNVAAGWGAGALGVVVLVAVGATVVTERHKIRPTKTLVVPCAVSALCVLVAVGSQRSSLGTSDTATGRYVVVLAILLAPALALTLQRIQRYDQRWLIVAAGLLGIASIANSMSWHDRQQLLITASAGDRITFELLADADLTGVDDSVQPSWCSPDVRIADIATLVDRGAVSPRPPASETEERLLDWAVLGLVTDGPGIDPRPCAP